jgi:hypothetical protein
VINNCVSDHANEAVNRTLRDTISSVVERKDMATPPSWKGERIRVRTNIRWRESTTGAELLARPQAEKRGLGRLAAVAASIAADADAPGSIQREKMPDRRRRRVRRLSRVDKDDVILTGADGRRHQVIGVNRGNPELGIQPIEAIRLKSLI